MRGPAANPSASAQMHEATAELLNGQTVTPLLKDFGNLFNARAAAAATAAPPDIPPGGPGSWRSGSNSSSGVSAQHRRADLELDQLQALRSLTVLVCLLEKRITLYTPHIMAVLTAGLLDCASADIKCQVRAPSVMRLLGSPLADQHARE